MANIFKFRSWNFIGIAHYAIHLVELYACKLYVLECKAPSGCSRDIKFVLKNKKPSEK